MSNRREKFGVLRLAMGLWVVATLAVINCSSLVGSPQKFSIPDDVALRVRLDDTLTSVDSEVGDPFSATVVERGDYQNASVYGHIAQIDMSGRIKGHTSMMLRFDRLVMPDGAARPFTPRLLSFITRPPVRRSMSKARSSPAAEAAKPSNTLS